MRILDQSLLELPNRRIASRSLDNRIGAVIVLQARTARLISAYVKTLDTDSDFIR
jgi:putative aminopeptidase FrvX